MTETSGWWGPGVGVDDALLGEVLGRLDDRGVDDDAGLLALAACEGDEELARALGGEPLTRPDLPPAAGPAEPAGAYLRSVTVEGFRGVGPARTLEVTPGPGLTVVVGRNGSGKSSFAEAAELALTGDNRRRSAGRPGDGWRNLHRPEPAAVTVGLCVEGAAGVTTVTRRWPPGGRRMRTWPCSRSASRARRCRRWAGSSR